VYRHRNIFPFLVALSLLVSVGGCHGVLKSSWNNFTAYYNTFYNAKHQYEDGLKQIEKQKVPINAEEPIPVFSNPIFMRVSSFLHHRNLMS
jgi:hypothetical protein